MGNCHLVATTTIAIISPYSTSSLSHPPTQVQLSTSSNLSISAGGGGGHLLSDTFEPFFTISDSHVFCTKVGERL